MTVYRFTQAPMNASCYVVLTDEAGLVIDPCVEPDRVYEKLGRSIRITHILITHGHFDHIWKLDEWSEAAKPEVLISESDLCMLTSPLMNASAVFCGIPEVICQTKPDTLLFGGEKLLLGDISVTVYPAKGHTEGGLLFLVDNCLFSGDTLFYGSYGRYDLYGGNPEELRETLSSMSRFKGRGLYLFPGHGEKCLFDDAYNAL